MRRLVAGLVTFGIVGAAALAGAVAADAAPSGPDLKLGVVGEPSDAKVNPLGTQSTVTATISLDSVGTALDAATIAVTLPAAMQLAGDITLQRGSTQTLSCTTSAATVSCPVTDLRTKPKGSLAVPVTATTAAMPGTVVQLQVSATPTGGTDVNPGDNSVAISFRYAGTGALTTTLAPAKTVAPVGASVAIPISVLNDGQQAAPNPTVTVGAAAADKTVRFLVAGFSGKTRALRSGETVPDPVGAKAGSVRYWAPDSLEQGQVAQATLTIQGKAAGKVEVVVYANSEANNGCTDDPITFANCPAAKKVTITFTATAASTPPSGGSSTPPPSGGASSGGSGSGTGHGLAATGARQVPGLLVGGLGAIAVGLMLCAAARRRPVARVSAE